jgi:peroxiredoxin
VIPLSRSMLSTHPAAVPKLHPKHTAVADISRLLKKRQKENVHLTPALNTALLLRKIGTRHPLPYHALMNIETPAPDFTLYATDGETITLSEQTGTPTVLVFFPAAFTGVCETEVCTFRDAMTAFNDIGATVYGISVDSRFALAAFAATEPPPTPTAFASQGLPAWTATTLQIEACSSSTQQATLHGNGSQKASAMNRHTTRCKRQSPN